MSEHAVVVSKTINATREDLFEAFTNPEIMSSWFYPEDDMSADVSNEFEVGGSYTIKMHAGNGGIYTHVGEYKEIVPNEKLVFTWNSDFVQNTVVTVTFSETDAGLKLLLHMISCLLKKWQRITERVGPVVSAGWKVLWPGNRI